MGNSMYINSKVVKAIVLVLLLSGCGCATGYNRKLDSWKGHNINELVQSWGYPSQSFNAPNGALVYLYQTNVNGFVPAYTTSPNFAEGQYTFGGTPTSWYCRTFFEVDEHKDITTWRYEGNICK